MKIEYKIIRSERRSLAVQVKNGEVIVRAPKNATEARIKAFIEGHGAWIEKQLENQKRTAPEQDELLSKEDILELAEKARRVIPERVRLYADRVGVNYGRITIRNQRGRWGSCSSKGNLNFNCLLMLAPIEVLDSVVVHELCHIKEMNHSERFYREVLRVYPEYYKWHGWLKTSGEALLRRMAG